MDCRARKGLHEIIQVGLQTLTTTDVQVRAGLTE